MTTSGRTGVFRWSECLRIVVISLVVATVVGLGAAGSAGASPMATLLHVYDLGGGVESATTTLSPNVAFPAASSASAPSLPRGPAIVASRPFSATEDAEDTVSLFKAPQPGRGASQFENGYSAADFPGGPGQDSDGLAYFARDKSIADEFADSYGEGVIETKVPRSVYESQYAQFEYPYQGGPRTEVPIPASAVEGLNPFERIWHP
jgi:hypothetical protein